MDRRPFLYQSRPGGPRRAIKFTDGRAAGEYPDRLPFAPMSIASKQKQLSSDMACQPDIHKDTLPDVNFAAGHASCTAAGPPNIQKDSHDAGTGRRADRPSGDPMCVRRGVSASPRCAAQDNHV